MQFKFYKYSLTNSNYEEINHHKIPLSIINKLKKLEILITNEYLAKQKNRLGIKKLGNEIKNNEKIKNIFNKSTDDKKRLIKLTAHYQTYLGTIIESINNFKNEKLFYFVFENDFRRESNLVDNSSRDSKFVLEKLNYITSSFYPKSSKLNNIYIVEMSYFSDYYIKDYDGFTKIIKKEI